MSDYRTLLGDTSLVISATSLPRVDVFWEAAARYAQNSRSAATRRAYTGQWRSFSAWMEARGAVPLPAAPELVAAYLAHRAEAGVRPSTLAQCLAAISEAHRMKGFDSPREAAVVREVWKGIKRTVGVEARRVSPVSLQALRAMVRACPIHGAGLRDRAMLCLGFAGAFRRSELVALEVTDISFVDDGLVVIVRRSKTDQEGEGSKVGVPFGSHRDTCPVRSLRAWLEHLGADQGPLFRSVTRGGRVGERLDGRDVARIIKRRAEGAGLDPVLYSGHSLRAGLATEAARAGRGDRAIMRQGRWRSRTMVDRYVREASLFDDNAAAGIGL